MLMAAGLELPKQVFGHGWLLVGGEKMSKSKLTGIAPTQITDTFGSDAFRFYFMRAITFGQDGSFSWEDLSARYESELANGFGNLASRVIAMVNRYFDGSVPKHKHYTEADKNIQHVAAKAVADADAAIEKLAIHDALAAIWVLVDELNGYITVQEPWALAKDDSNRDRLATVLYTCLEGLRVLAILLAPIMPKATNALWNAIAEISLGELEDQPLAKAAVWGQLHHGAAVREIEALFPRIEQE
jgi:methionyl-tRNA synthetase